MEPDDPDQQTVDRLRGGDKVAFESFYKRYEEALYWYCHRILRQHEDAEDATATTLAQLWTSRGKMKDPSHIRNFLYKVARNACVDQMRVKGKEDSWRGSTDDYDQLAEKTPEPDERERFEILAAEFQVADLREYVRSEIARLPKGCQEVCRLHFLEQKTIEEAATIIGIERSTAYAHRSHGRDLLRKALSKKVFCLIMLLWGLGSLFFLKKSFELFSNPTGLSVYIYGPGSYEKVQTLNRFI
jgi:RNA polymerase sigma-70 factor (ECF subfamily)